MIRGRSIATMSNGGLSAARMNGVKATRPSANSAGVRKCFRCQQFSDNIGVFKLLNSWIQTREGQDRLHHPRSAACVENQPQQRCSRSQPACFAESSRRCGSLSAQPRSYACASPTHLVTLNLVPTDSSLYISPHEEIPCVPSPCIARLGLCYPRNPFAKNLRQQPGHDS